MADINDMGRIGYVLENYDAVDFARDQNGNIVTSKAFLSKDGKPAPVLLFVKRVNGFYMVSEAVTDTKSGKMYITSAYKNDNNPLDNNVVQLPNVNAAKPQSLGLTSETSPAPHRSDNNIISGRAKINTQPENILPPPPRELQL